MFFRSRLFFFPPFVSLHCSRPKSLIFFCFFSLSFLLGHPPPSPTDGPLKLSAPSRPSFHLSTAPWYSCNPLFWVALTVLSVVSLRLVPFPPTLSSSYGTHDSLSLSFLELSSSPSPSLHKSIRIDYYPGLHTPGDLARLPSGRFELGLAPVVVVSELLALFPFLFISYRLGHIKRRENSQQQIPTFT